MLKKVSCLLSSLALVFCNAYSQQSTPRLVNQSLEAVRISEPPTLDGVLDDDCWKKSNITSGFKQYKPLYNSDPSSRTEVRLVYDNSAIYVSAMMYDNQPDSINRQLGLRDDPSIFADWFYVCFDTYNASQDSYFFGVTTSGVQREIRQADQTFNTVWGSATKINDSGWVAEMRIPYSALRFPATEQQTWGLQFFRVVSRNNEEHQWSLIDRSSQNILNYWGALTGLSNINPPARISAVPYLTIGMQGNSTNKTTKYSYSGGMDLKWGLNESFTLDMILMPDFSQVQTDNTVKNLSAFEVQYDEKRPFFNEGTDLFQKGKLFYSRRIGRTPLLRGSVSDSLRSGEFIVSNPMNAKLVNAMKVSGRSNKGWGLGFFNAITGNTMATIKDSIGNEREIITDPFTNYNIMVVDKTLRNNSSFFLINTNVTRPDGWKKSNVTATGLRLADKSSTYQVNGSMSMSNTFEPGKTNKAGFAYNFDIQKIKGNFRFTLGQNGMNKDYNRNDMGFNKETDWTERWGEVKWNEYNPRGIFRDYGFSLGYMSQTTITSGKNLFSYFKYSNDATFTNYWYASLDFVTAPFDIYDFYEPRRAGFFFINPGFNELELFVKSDTRKMASVEGEIEIGADYKNHFWREYTISPLLRFSDRFNLKPEFKMQYSYNDKGWVSGSSSAINFGNRDTETFTYSLAGEYMFNNKLSLNLWLRQYRAKGSYDEFHTLNNDGSLTANPAYSGSHDFNYNSFNIDLVLGWEFSPGSMLNIVWKNAIEEEDAIYNRPYLENLDKLMNSPKANSLSIKLLYYIDYQMIRGRRS